MPVAEMLDRISSAELTEWAAFFETAEFKRQMEEAAY